MARTHAYVGFFQAKISRIKVRIGVTATYGMKFGLSVGENRMILGSLVLTHYQRVNDRRIHRQWPKSRSSIAERDKKTEMRHLLVI